MERTSSKRLDRGLPLLRIRITRQETIQKINYLTLYETILLHICSIYFENNLFSSNYFTLVNSSVTLINNYILSMANSNVTTESGGRQNMFPAETRPYIDESAAFRI